MGREVRADENSCLFSDELKIWRERRKDICKVREGDVPVRGGAGELRMKEAEWG